MVVKMEMKIFFPTFFSTRFLFYVCIKRIVHTTYIVQRKVYDKITNVVESSITNRFVGPKIVFFGLFLWANIKKVSRLKVRFQKYLVQSNWSHYLSWYFETITNTIAVHFEMLNQSNLDMFHIGTVTINTG